MTDRQPQGRWKGIQYDYDALLAADDSAACLYCLSDRDVALVLASMEFFGWKTRYFSLSNTAIDQDTIDAWQGHLGAALMTCTELRQDPDNACELQQQDEGGDWTTWANLRKCPPDLFIVGGSIVVKLPDGSFVMPGESDTFDGRDTPYTPPSRSNPPDDAICLAAQNAVNALYVLHVRVYSGIFVPNALNIALALVAIIVGLLALPIAAAIIVSSLIAGGGVVILSGVGIDDFTFAVKKRLQCILQDNATNTSGVVTFDFAAVQADIASRIVGINIWSALDLYLSIIGESGLNRAGATTAITDVLCVDCAVWCYNFHDGARLDEWVAEDFVGATATYSSGMWHSAVASGGDTAVIWISWTLGAASTLTDAAITICDPSDTNRAIFVNGDGTPFSGTNIWQNGFIVGSPFPVSVTRIDVYVLLAHDSAPRTLSALQFSGEDDNPFGDDNC